MNRSESPNPPSLISLILLWNEAKHAIHHKTDKVILQFDIIVKIVVHLLSGG